MDSFLLFIAFIALIGSSLMTIVSGGLRSLRKYHSKDRMLHLTRGFFYRRWHKIFFPKKTFNTLLFSTLCARHILLFCYAVSIIAFLIRIGDLSEILPPTLSVAMPQLPWTIDLFIGLAGLSLSLVFGDLLPRAYSARSPEKALKIASPLASLYLLICFPITFLFIKFFDVLTKDTSEDAIRGVSMEYTDKILEILREASETGHLSQNDYILLSSVIQFKDRIVREIMKPRIEMFALPAHTTIEQAAALIHKEGYSRIPVFGENIDQIIGMLMYKDILQVYREKNLPLEHSIEELVKPALYTPETKKISQLLQEFRAKKTHMAIVVDEYGGTEGLVTFEDILEEIVGEIDDEYDEVEEVLFSAQPGGGWIVDARMNLLDAEENFHIKIPQDSDYDTIAGYIFHRAGTIPSKGFRIHHDDFDMEVLSSNDRTVRKVRIIPANEISL